MCFTSTLNLHLIADKGGLRARRRRARRTSSHSSCSLPLCFYLDGYRASQSTQRAGHYNWISMAIGILFLSYLLEPSTPEDIIISMVNRGEFPFFRSRSSGNVFILHLALWLSAGRPSSLLAWHELSFSAASSSASGKASTFRTLCTVVPFNSFCSRFFCCAKHKARVPHHQPRGSKWIAPGAVMLSVERTVTFFSTQVCSTYPPTKAQYNRSEEEHFNFVANKKRLRNRSGINNSPNLSITASSSA